MALYTPGSTAGLPLAVLSSLAAPPAAVREDAELLRERAGTTSASILGLLGIDADPVRSREQILLSTLLERGWAEGKGLDLAGLVGQVQRPPVTHVGVLDLDTFFGEKDRFELAMALNNLLASPGFAAWREGEPLDVDRLLYTPAGRPRIAICSIAHLSDRERMFFVTLLLDQTLAWMRGKPGTSSLRAILYMDEVFGYLPPVAEPPSKRPLLTLLKQARAFGLGVVLATQNPVDLDYKGLTNIGTWLLGRLQADRDKQRLLDGLEGAAQGKGPSRAELDALLSRLRSRLFLLHNVHEDAPVVFESRWAMSYLRGPLTRQEIRRLTDGDRAEGAAAATAASVPPPPASPADATVAPPAAHSAPPAAAARATEGRPAPPPLLPAGVIQLREPARGEGGVWRPALAAWGRVWYRDARKRIEHSDAVAVVVPIPGVGAEPAWAGGESPPGPLAELEQGAPSGADLEQPPPSATRAASWRSWEASFKRHLRGGLPLDLWRHASSGEVSAPGEGERELRIRISELARGQRDARLDAVRRRWAKRAGDATERVRRAQQKVTEQEGQLRGSQMQTAISVGATVLGALFGRRAISHSSLGRATTAARGYGRQRREAMDVEEARRRLAEAQAELAEIERQTTAELATAERAERADLEPLEPLRLLPKEVEVGGVGLLWRWSAS